MSDITTKLQSIEQIPQLVHTGSETLDQRKQYVKNFIAGDAQTVAAPATTYAFTHQYHDEYLKLTGLTGATTINLTAGSDLQVGATLTIDVVQGGTGRNLVLGTNIVGDDLTGVADDRDVLVLKYTATDTWVLISNTKIVNAA